MIKWSIHREAITIINIPAPNIRALKYIKQTLSKLKGDIDKNTTAGHFYSLLSIVDRKIRQ